MAEQTKAASREWNYHPEFPIDNNPLFSWPIRWKDAAVYYRDGWLTLSESSLFIIMALAAFYVAALI